MDQYLFNFSVMQCLIIFPETVRLSKEKNEGEDKVSKLPSMDILEVNPLLNCFSNSTINLCQAGIAMTIHSSMIILMILPHLKSYHPCK